MKLTKKIIKEMVEKELNEKGDGLWANIHAKRKRGEKPAKPGDKDYPKTLDIDEGLTRWKIYVKGESKPFVVSANSSSEAKKLAYMMLKNNKVKVDKVIKELKFGSQAQYDSYKRKHHIKKGTQITVGGKKTTHKGKGKISKASAKKADKMAADMNAKLDALEKEMEKKKKNEGKLSEGRKFKYKKNDWKKYNQLVKKGKSVMIQTAFGDEFAWEDGSNYGVFGSESDGREIELSHDDIDQIEVF